MSNVRTPEVSSYETLAVGPTQSTAEAIGGVACITLGQEISLVQLLDGTIPFTAETLIYERSGAQIDAAELLTHVEWEV